MSGCSAYEFLLQLGYYLASGILALAETEISLLSQCFRLRTLYVQGNKDARSAHNEAYAQARFAGRERSEENEGI